MAAPQPGRVGKTGFDSGRGTFRIHPRFAHIINVLFAGDGAFPEGAIIYCLNETACLFRLYAGFDEVAHDSNITLIADENRHH